ncbi:hypothetical protein DRO53_03590 [Candidatus Bathyarchaeota archaeon]|nr:MAG: hypothetical protein DRO53_03590 [Candidatus Bathyarchaeota archaeon]
MERDLDLESVLLSLEGFYWLVRTLSEMLDEFKDRSPAALRTHAFLASNRIKIIAENLREALKRLGLNVENRLGEKELAERVGMIGVDLLKELREALERLTRLAGDGGNLDGKWLASILLNAVRSIDLASGFIRIFSQILEAQGKPEYRQLSFILQTVVRDLEIIKSRHEELARLFHG